MPRLKTAAGFFITRSNSSILCLVKNVPSFLNDTAPAADLTFVPGTVKIEVMASQNPFPATGDRSTVELVDACGEWFVRVVEHGEPKTMSFDLESFAIAYAEGQRRRLKLDRIVRV